MNIAYLSTMTGYYGGEVHLAGLADGMRERGHQVLCVVRPESQLEKRLPRLGLPVEVMPLLHWYDPVMMSRLGRLLRKRNIEILHTHVPRDYYTAAVASLGSDVVNVGTRHQLHPIGLPVLKRPFLGRFEAMIAVSEAVKGGLIGSLAMDNDRIVTVPNGIALPRTPVAEAPLAGPLRLACGATADDPVVGFVGQLCPSKGLETLIRACARLARGWPRLKLCVIGEGGESGHYLARLKQLAAELGLARSVHFLGYRPDAARAAAEFNVQVISSLAEPFGLVTLEAMAQSRPVVATNTGGSPEIVRDGVEGFLVRPGDAVQLAGRLDVLLDSPGLCREMGRRGSQRVAREFSLDLMLDRTEAVYRQALGKSDRRPVRASA
jgi:glycosyltransferase involved in cell wall biosynthesis